MDNANLYVGNTEVFVSATFERLPIVGEYVAYQGQWRPVTIVGHTWSNDTNAPVANISLGDPSGPSLASFRAGADFRP